jgi:hypothetical protein
MVMSIMAFHGRTGKQLMAKIGAVLEPLAAQYRGTEALTLRPIIRRAWSQAFHAELPEPALSRCAAAIRAGQPWQLALWAGSWS